MKTKRLINVVAVVALVVSFSVLGTSVALGNVQSVKNPAGSLWNILQGYGGQSVKSQANVQSVKSQANVQSVKSQANVQSVKSQANVQSVKNQANVQSVKSQANVQSVTNVQSVKSQANVQSVKSQANVQYSTEPSQRPDSTERPPRGRGRSVCTSQPSTVSDTYPKRTYTDNSVRVLQLARVVLPMASGSIPLSVTTV